MEPLSPLTIALYVRVETTAVPLSVQWIGLPAIIQPVYFSTANLLIGAQILPTKTAECSPGNIVGGWKSGVDGGEAQRAKWGVVQRRWVSPRFLSIFFAKFKR